jgi:hypothetical protein
MTKTVNAASMEEDEFMRTAGADLLPQLPVSSGIILDSGVLPQWATSSLDSVGGTSVGKFNRVAEDTDTDTDIVPQSDYAHSLRYPQSQSQSQVKTSSSTTQTNTPSDYSKNNRDLSPSPVRQSSAVYNATGGFTNYSPTRSKINDSSLYVDDLLENQQQNDSIGEMSASTLPLPSDIPVSEPFVWKDGTLRQQPSPTNRLRRAATTCVDWLWGLGVNNFEPFSLVNSKTCKDFSDGTLIVQLVEKLEGVEILGTEARPTHWAHRVANVRRAFECIATRNKRVPLRALSCEEGILTGDSKTIVTLLVALKKGYPLKNTGQGHAFNEELHRVSQVINLDSIRGGEIEGN